MMKMVLGTAITKELTPKQIVKLETMAAKMISENKEKKKARSAKALAIDGLEFYLFHQKAMVDSPVILNAWKCEFARSNSIGRIEIHESLSKKTGKNTYRAYVYSFRKLTSGSDREASGYGKTPKSALTAALRAYEGNLTSALTYSKKCLESSECRLELIRDSISRMKTQIADYEKKISDFNSLLSLMKGTD